jgi:hypothetical protein
MRDRIILFCGIFGGICGAIDGTILSATSRAILHTGFGRFGLAGDLAIYPLIWFLKWRESKS